MLLQLLTAPRLVINGEPAHVGSRKALAILSLLALDGSATREQLAQRLWPDADVGAARRNLRRELFRLRELGVPLRDMADGALSLDGSISVDALQLLRADELPKSNGSALEGLDGVGDIEFDAWLQRWREQLSLHQAQLLAREATQREQRGDLEGALASHMQRWGADACNEGAAVDVIRLRAALGDRAGALQAYERLTNSLRAELDLEPSEPTRKLARALREQLGVASDHDAAPATAAHATDAARATDVASEDAQAQIASVAPALPAIAPFIARARIQKLIEGAWARGQRVYLHGPAGTGKTRLSSEMASARGAWLRVACEPQDAEVPYASVVRLLRALRNSAPDVVLPDWVRRELTQLMPELGEPPQALATDEARQRLLAAIGEAWRLLMHENFSAIVLDDWHWGDPASVDVWSRLEEPEHGETVVWLIAYRSAQLPPAALERQRADIDSRRGSAIELEGLEPEEVLALTHALSGSAGGRLFSQRLHGSTEGNPFFLLETLRHLFERGLLTADASGWSTPFDEQTENYAELPVPASVRAAVQARVRALGAAAQRVLEAGSLGGPDLDAALLGSVVGVDEEGAIAAFEHAHSAQLVHETSTGWRFAHDLVRQSLVQGLSTGRRRLLHERLAQHFEVKNVSAALIAAQWEAAQRPRFAIRWRIAAAESALQLHALDEALTGYAQALADGADAAAAAEIHMASAAIHRRRGDRQAADDALASAASAAAIAGAPAGVLKVQLMRAGHLGITDRVDDCLATLDALADELATAPPTLRAKALVTRADALMRRGDYTSAIAFLAEAQVLLDQSPHDRHELAGILQTLARCHYWGGDIESMGRHARRAVAVLEALDDRAGLATALSLLGLYLKRVGQLDKSLAVGERARSLAAAAGNVPVHRNVSYMLLQTCMDSGDTDRVLRLLDEGLALSPVFENRLGEQNFEAARFYVHYMRGEVETALAAADRLLTLSKRDGQALARVGYLQMVAEMHLDLGDPAAARPLIEEAQLVCDAQRARGDGNYFGATQAFKQATLALAEGQPKAALAWVSEAVPEDVNDRFYQSWLGAAGARALGDKVGARARLDAVGIDDGAPVHPLTLWLEQRLVLAAEEGRSDAAAIERAEALLAERRAPALLADRLRRAIDAAPR